jgi:hypothetical protein
VSVLSNILGKIFHPHKAAAPADAAAPTPQAAAPAQPAASEPTAAEKADPAYVESLLDTKAAAHAEKLDWRHSIVDLMKTLDLDSSFAARKELAKELSYSGDTGDSAAMNVWLHAQVMQKVAEHRGKLDQDLNARA